MRFNKEQREGLAKVADNVAAASAVALIVAPLIVPQIDWVAAALLGVVTAVLLLAGFMLRN